MLSPGTRLGSYEVVSAIGAGGMGEVYKGRDVRLDRVVALKVLPSSHAADAERNLRLGREAKAISSMSHAHICSLYDLGQQDGVQYLVMEYLEGETLETRLRKGPLPVAEVLRISIQIAEALDHAHRLNIVHRDLKPGNIMLTRAGVKLLDFGLAKAVMPTAAATMTALPTVSRALTAEGAIAGTFQYMAPEQFEGADADPRSDIFAFGAVMYEMLAGKKAFEGKSQASLIGAIMNGTVVPVSTIQPTTPPVLEHLIKTCLATDPESRWQTARDVLVQLKWIAEGGSQAGVAGPAIVPRKKMGWIPWAVAGVCAAALGVLLWSRFGEPKQQAAVTRFTLTLPSNIDLPASTPFVSPDGRSIVFAGGSRNSESKLWLRRMDSDVPREIATGRFTTLFWSPDSRYIGVISDGKLIRIDTNGGPPLLLCDTLSSLGASWNDQGYILLGATRSDPSIRVLPQSGGDVKVALQPSVAERERSLSWPFFLPDGRHFIYVANSDDTSRSFVRVGMLGSTETTTLFSGDSRTVYVDPGYLLFSRSQTLFAQRFDATKLKLIGEAIPLVARISRGQAGVAVFSASRNGVLAYQTGQLPTELLRWYDRSGKASDPIVPAGLFRQAPLSPDGGRAAVEVFNQSVNRFNLSILNLANGILSPLTRGEIDDSDPVWSPDGREIAFASSKKGQLDVYRQTIGFSDAKPVWVDDERKVPEAWLKDGTILFTTQAGKNYYVIAANGNDRPHQILHVDFSTDEPDVSPDQKWIAFNSLESGRWEVYVASFPGFADKRQISKDGGSQPRWRGDGKELFFLDPSGKMMAVAVNAGSTIETAVPTALFQTDVQLNPFQDQYGVTPDGKRFFVGDAMRVKDAPIYVVLNWPEIVRR